MSNDKRYVCAGGKDGYLYYMDMSEGKAGKEAEDDEDKVKNSGVKKVEIEKWGKVKSLAFGIGEGGSGGGDSVVYVGTNSGKVCEVDLSRGEVVRTFTGHTQAVNGISLKPDGNTLITGSHDKTVRAWNVATEVGEGENKATKEIKEESWAQGGGG